VRIDIGKRDPLKCVEKKKLNLSDVPEGRREGGVDDKFTPRGL